MKRDNGVASPDGFTLIELVIVMIIIGVLAAISIPTFMTERDRANRSAVQSDLRNAAVNAESYFAQVGTYNGLEAHPFFTDINESAGVSLSIDAVDTTSTRFCVEGVHAGLPSDVWSFDNTRSLQISDTGC